MPEEIMTTIREYRDKGSYIYDEEVEEIREFCIRKMEVAGIKNQEEYFPLLFADELKNYLFRRMVNATSILRKMGELVNV